MISKWFEIGALPVIFDVGKTIFFIGLSQGAYYIMRTDRKAGIDKIKYATTGYVILKFSTWFVMVVDRISADALKGLM